MINIKLVVIGSSGVGKTSLRSQYISGRFSNGYRATIGADFITKTLPHPTIPDETVVLQIWDTAGQERFSSLSSAFFRGADAAVLMFDVNAPETLKSLEKWWSEFREQAPLADEDMEDYCCVVVGNKTDLVVGSPAVSASEAIHFLDRLVPPSGESNDGASSDDDSDEIFLSSSQATERPPIINRSDSIAIATSRREISTPSHSPKHRFSKSRSRSSSRFYSGTMTTTHTTLTIYHTPSSSVYDSFHSARTSPMSSVLSSPNMRARAESISSGSGATITPSLFARERETTATTPTGNNTPSPMIVHRGPKLFLTSAKTGEGVRDVFEYVVRRVITKWDFEERIEARRLHLQESSFGGPTQTISIGLDTPKSLTGTCCGT